MANIREYKLEDREKIIHLYNDIFKDNRDLDYWSWQFKDNPMGKSIIVVAEEDTEILGQSNLVPSNLNYKGQEIPAGVALDSMVHKDHRRKGIFEEMTRKTYEIGYNNGIGIKYGFPVYGALIGLTEKLDATLVEDIPLFINVYRLDNFLQSKIKNKLLAKILSIPSFFITKFIYREVKIKPKEDYIIKEIKEFDKDFDILWNKFREDTPLMTSRTSEYLNWRITNHPRINYTTFGAYLNDELVGYIIIKIDNRKIKKSFDLKIGTIMDMVALDENIIAQLYYRARTYFKEQNTDFVVCWTADSMLYRNLFIKLGFYKTKSKITFVVKELLGNKEIEELALAERNWYIMPIESDIY